MFKATSLLAKANNTGSAILVIVVILGIFFWRPLLKRVYTLLNRKNGITCYICNKQTKDFLLDNDFNPYCRHCSEMIIKK